MTDLEAIQTAIESVNERHDYSVDGHAETTRYQAAIETAVAGVGPDVAVQFHDSPVRGGWLGCVEGEGQTLYFAADAVAILSR